MGEYYLLLDVGGTQIKAGLFDSKGELVMPIKYFPSLATEEKEVILSHFAEIVREFVNGQALGLLGIGMAFPGPFDYEKGISLMKGLGKYDSIYGLSLDSEIRDRVAGTHDIKFLFLHDVEAFAVGESWFGQAANAESLLCLCIGTGAGSAFIRNKEVQKREMDGVPLNGWLYNTPYKDSVIDEYLSVRGLMRLSKRIAGEGLSGKELFERCKLGDEKAILVYREFGKDVKACMKPFLEGFHPEALVLGGQISYSFSYFGKELNAVCEDLNIAVCLEPDTSLKAMQGLWVKMSLEGGNAYVKP